MKLLYRPQFPIRSTLAANMFESQQTSAQLSYLRETLFFSPSCSILYTCIEYLSLISL